MFPLFTRISATWVGATALLLGCVAAGSGGSVLPPAQPGPSGQAAPAGGGGAGQTAGSSPASGAPGQVAPAGAGANSPGAGMAYVIFGADTVRAEVARTSAERSQGLMYRDSLPDGTGMIFVFESAENRSFWMQNTYVALDIAFLDSSYRIINIEQMEPRTEDLHDSEAPALFALEVPKGWFAKKGIEAGATAKIVFSGGG